LLWWHASSIRPATDFPVAGGVQHGLRGPVGGSRSRGCADAVWIEFATVNLQNNSIGGLGDPAHVRHERKREPNRTRRCGVCPEPWGPGRAV